MVLLARTTPANEVEDRLQGLSTFLVEMRKPDGSLIDGLTINPIETMMNHSTTEVFFDNVEIPASALIGEEGNGFRQILGGMNAERILIASECIGDGKFFLERASAYANERVVFDRPIGMNQGVQFPLAKAQIHLEAADLMRWRACDLYDAGESCAPRPTWPSSWPAICPGKPATPHWTPTAVSVSQLSYDIERKLRETRLYQVAPINNNLILAFVAQKRLGLPKSY